jgi:hypothetical protein
MAAVILGAIPAYAFSCDGGEAADSGTDAGQDGGRDGGTVAPVEVFGDGGWEYYGSGCDVWGVGIKVNTHEALYCEGISSSQKSGSLVWREIHPGYGLNAIIPSGACCQKGGDTVFGVFACEHAGSGYIPAHRRELLTGDGDVTMLLCLIRSVHECELK